MKRIQEVVTFNQPFTHSLINQSINQSVSHISYVSDLLSTITHTNYTNKSLFLGYNWRRKNICFHPDIKTEVSVTAIEKSIVTQYRERAGTVSLPCTTWLTKLRCTLYPFNIVVSAMTTLIITNYPWSKVRIQSNILSLVTTPLRSTTSFHCIADPCIGLSSGSCDRKEP